MQHTKGAFKQSKSDYGVNKYDFDRDKSKTKFYLPEGQEILSAKIQIFYKKMATQKINIRYGKITNIPVAGITGRFKGFYWEKL